MVHVHLCGLNNQGIKLSGARALWINYMIDTCIVSLLKEVFIVYVHKCFYILLQMRVFWKME